MNYRPVKIGFANGKPYLFKRLKLAASLKKPTGIGRCHRPRDGRNGRDYY